MIDVSKSTRRSEFQTNAFGLMQPAQRGVELEVVPNDASATSIWMTVPRVKSYLSASGINVSAPGRRNAQRDLGSRGLDAVVRAGVHYFNTTDEVGCLVDAVARL